MRTVTYGAACSLDGFIADRDGGVDWLHFSRDVEQEMRRYWASVDTVLVGRKTWEAGLALGGGAPMPGVRSYVFSRTLAESGRRGVELVREDAAAFVRGLVRQPGGGICVMGGGELARALFAAGLIDEVGLNVHPVLLGAGVPLFRDPGRRVALELAASRVIAGGCVLSTYRVRRAAGG